MAASENKSLWIRVALGAAAFFGARWSGLSDGVEVLGYSVDGGYLTTGATATAAFLPDLLGYIWSFIQAKLGDTATDRKLVLDKLDIIIAQTKKDA